MPGRERRFPDTYPKLRELIHKVRRELESEAPESIEAFALESLLELLHIAREHYLDLEIPLQSALEARPQHTELIVIQRASEVIWRSISQSFLHGETQRMQRNRYILLRDSIRDLEIVLSANKHDLDIIAAGNSQVHTRDIDLQRQASNVLKPDWNYYKKPGKREADYLIQKKLDHLKRKRQ